MVFEASMVIGAIGYAVGIVVWIFNKFSSTKAEIKEEVLQLIGKDTSSIGRTLDGIKEDLDTLNQIQLEHAKRISQADTIFVHMDETMKGLSKAVVELNHTLTALQIVVAKIEK